MDNIFQIKERDLGYLRCFWRLMLAIIFIAAGMWKCFILKPLGHVAMFFLNHEKPEFNFSGIFPEWLLMGIGIAIPIVELAVGLLLLVGYKIRLVLYVIGLLLLVVLIGHLLKEPLFSPLNHIFLRALIMSFIWVLPAHSDRLSVDYWR
jgi:uncharacterized membrane protein YphA (DoxX/SURF4 family)